MSMPKLSLREAHSLGCCRLCHRDFIGQMPESAICTRCWQKFHRAAMQPVVRGKR